MDAKRHEQPCADVGRQPGWEGRGAAHTKLAPDLSPPSRPAADGNHCSSARAWAMHFPETRLSIHTAAAGNRQSAIDGRGRLGEDSERMHESERSPAKRQRSGSLLTPHGWLPVVWGWSLSVNCSQAAQVDQPAFECFPVSDLERVFEDGYGPLERGTRRHRVPPGGGRQTRI
jgi:hypothetical protein